MNVSEFIRLPKKPKAPRCNEYRTLSMMSHFLKFILKIILNRNKKSIVSEISDTQSGFVEGKGTREGIINMRTICERYLDLKKPVYICFIDYEKAFDRVNHQKLIDCLTRTNMRDRDTTFIKNLYWTQKAYIKLENTVSNDIKIKRGVRQGCVLSPSLLNLSTEHIFPSLEDLEGVNIGGMNVNNLRYADDTALLAETSEALQHLLDTLSNKGKEFGMKINVKKTKVMTVTRINDITPYVIEIDGTPVEEVTSYTYLGQLLSSNGKNEDDIIRRISIARSTFNKMRSTLTNKSISLETRKRIMRCYIWSTLLYGAETWTLTSAMVKRLEAFEMWIYRRMLKISWTDKMSNKEVLRRANANRQLMKTIRQRLLQFFDNIHRVLIEGKINGKRGRGRPITSWVNNIVKWTGLDYPSVVRTAQDRHRWKAVSFDPLTVDGT